MDKIRLDRWIIAVVFSCTASVAAAQSSGGFTSGQTLSAAQLNSAFSAKQDFPIALGSTLSGGTSGRILYDNAGAFGERAPSGNGTTVATTAGSLTSGNCVKIDASGNLADAGSACGSGGGVTFPAYTASTFYVPFGTLLSNGGSAVTANTIYCSPGVVTTSVHINQLSVRVSTAGSTNSQIAIYSDAVNSISGLHGPGTLVVNTGDIANTATGVISGSVSSTSIPAGTYWLCANANDSSVAYRTSSTGVFIGSIFGVSTAVTALEGFFVGYSTSQTFGSWPSSLGSASLSQDTSHSPIVALFISSVP